jgi:histidinol-phosphatase (PHP family)
VFDLHTHLWPHESGTTLPTYDELARACDAAARVGVQQIAITEHCHRFEAVAEIALERWRRDDASALLSATDRVWALEGGAHLDDYVALLTTAQARGLPLLVGLEVDHLPGANDAIAELLAPYPFDVLLGSVHWLGSWLFDAYDDPVFAAEWHRRRVDDVWNAYADAVIELAQSGTVDVIAHVDVIKVAGHRPVDVSGFETRLARALATSDIAVEVSSAGLRKPAGELYPSSDLLGKLAAAGVPLTTASDAHRVDRLGDRLDAVYASLGAHGVEQVATFDRRRRQQVPIG